MPVPASPSPPPPESLPSAGPNPLLYRAFSRHPHPSAPAPRRPLLPIARHPRHPASQWHPFFFSSHQHHEHNHTNLLLRPLFDSKTLLTSLHPSSLPTSKTGPDRPLLPPPLPPDYKPEIRPHYPGGWGSGVGSQASRAVTFAVSRRRGRSGPAFRALARFCLPRRVPCVAPAKAPCVAPAKAPCVAPATGGGDGPTDRGLFFAAQGRTRNAASRTRNCRDVLPPR